MAAPQMPPPTTTTSKVPAASAAGSRLMHHSGVLAVRQRCDEPHAGACRAVSFGPEHPEVKDVLRTVEARTTLTREDRGRGDHRPDGATGPKSTRHQARGGSRSTRSQ